MPNIIFILEKSSRASSFRLLTARTFFLKYYMHHLQ